MICKKEQDVDYGIITVYYFNIIIYICIFGPLLIVWLIYCLVLISCFLVLFFFVLSSGKLWILVFYVLFLIFIYSLSCWYFCLVDRMRQPFAIPNVARILFTRTLYYYDDGRHIQQILAFSVSLGNQCFRSPWLAITSDYVLQSAKTARHA